MRRLRVALTSALLGFPLGAVAQQTAPRPPVVLDPAAIRKQAAQLADIRALLADPDPNVRLLTIREVAKSGDPIQRQLAIEAGLSSAESTMQEVALRAVLADTPQIVIKLSNADGTPITDASANDTYRLIVQTFDPSTGRLTGSGWTGQIQGAVLSFGGISSGESGTLVWQQELGEFQGTVNLRYGRLEGTRKAAWRPR